MKHWMLTFFLTFLFFSVIAQKCSVLAGPMLGHTELRSIQMWLQVSSGTDARSISIRYKPQGSEKIITVHPVKDDNPYVNVFHFSIYNLEPGTTYDYDLFLDKKKVMSGSFHTQQLWQYRTAPPDFSFITGSCSYINDAAYDRPGKPYGGDSSIFLTMAKEKADFMLWLGDNWYTREVDYYSAAGLNYRPARDRSMEVMQPLLRAMPHYAIWDDHDYGPNDMDKSYILKEDSRNTFKSFWANPSYGFNNEGIYTQFTWNDVDFFLLDDRWYRDNDKVPDSINGKPNKDKHMFGRQQLDWLKAALLQSSSKPFVSYRVIATGSQVLNTVSPYDCFCHFPTEYNELMDFIAENKINGIVFLTGDRHHSSIVISERKKAYPLYDITVSPFTSHSYKFSGAEVNSPIRLLGIEQKQNYARVSFSGKSKERKMLVEYFGLHGDKLADWSVLLSDLSFPAK